MEKLLSAQQVAEHLGMHPKTLYKALREDRIALKFIRVKGRSIAFRPRDVEAFLSAREVKRTGGGIRKRRKLTFIEQMKRKYPNLKMIMTKEEADEFFQGVKTHRTEEEWYQLAAELDLPE
ncbi:MAG: helix-turn-helix domain-containing protein [Candidatus Acidiferrum sp.]|jgi:excisionase family DNA binding protein